MTMPDDYEVVTDQDYDPDIKLGVPQDEWLDRDAQSVGISLSPELVAGNTWTIPNLNTAGTVPVTILGRRLTRHRARIWITGVQAATAVVLAKSIADIQNGVASNGLAGAGLLIPAAMIPFGGGGGLPWESQRECIAVAIGGTATIITLDESYAQSRNTDIRNLKVGAK